MIASDRPKERSEGQHAATQVLGYRAGVESLRILAVVVAAMLAASCSVGRNNICATVGPVEDDIGKLEDFAANIQDPIWLERRAANCLHRWGYRLAPSSDNGLTIAKAVMQACSGAVNDHVRNYAETTAKAYEERYPPGVVGVRERNEYAAELRTERMATLEREAHFRVQQGKAGKCKAPK